MPVQPRPSDTFTRENLLLGFSTVEFEPALSAGGFGAAVELGILSGEELQKEVEVLELERGDAGTLTVDREVLSKLKPSFQLETFNFRSDVAQYIFGAAQLTPVTADASAAVTNENVNLPAADVFDSFVNLDEGNLSEASIEITCGTITSESVGTGDGASGGTQGDYNLDYKIKAIGDVTEFLVAGVDEIAKVVAGSTPAAGEIAIEVGEEDSLTAGSGAITFGASEIPANGAAIVATYTPSFSTTGTDIVNLTDFVSDPTLGKLRFLHSAADASPFRLEADANQQPLEVDYTYNRKASTNLQPFTQGGGVFEGRATVKHLTDIGINFVWTIPSVSIRITDDALTFGADDFGVGTLVLNINDSGGATRFGTLELSSEPESAA